MIYSLSADIISSVILVIFKCYLCTGQNVVLFVISQRLIVQTSERLGSRHHVGLISVPLETSPISRQYGTEGLKWASHNVKRPKPLGTSDSSLA